MHNECCYISVGIYVVIGWTGELQLTVRKSTVAEVMFGRGCECVLTSSGKTLFHRSAMLPVDLSIIYVAVSV